VKRLKAGNDLAGGKHLDLELIVGRLGNHLRNRLGYAVERVERFRKARRQSPFDGRVGLRDSGLGDRSRRNAETGRSQKLTTFELTGTHGVALPGDRANARLSDQSARMPQARHFRSCKHGPDPAAKASGSVTSQ